MDKAEVTFQEAEELLSRRFAEGRIPAQVLMFMYGHLEDARQQAAYFQYLLNMKPASDAPTGQYL